MAKAARGIDFLNEQAIHRDIKPTDLLSFHGHVKLADFGLARFAGASTVSCTALGALGSLPPEICGEHRLPGTIDAYSLPATDVNLRAGCEPFGGNPAEIIERHKTGAPIRDGLSFAEAEIVRRAPAANTTE